MKAKLKTIVEGADDKTAAEILEEAVAGVAESGRPKALPLYPNVGRDPKRVPTSLAVFREDPPDGYLGAFAPELGEEDLRRLVGGRVLRLELKDAEGHVMQGGKRTLVIAADPVPTAAARAAATNGGRTTPLDDMTRNQDIVGKLWQMQTQQLDHWKAQTDRELERIKLEANAEREKRAQELEASLKRLQDEARVREDHLEAKHKRDLELERERIRERTEEAKRDREADSVRMQQWVTMMTQNQAAQTGVMTAALQASKTDLTMFGSMFEKVVGMATSAQDQDPAVAAWNTMGKGLESLAEIAGGSRNKKEEIKKLLAALPAEKREAVLRALVGENAKQLEGGGGNGKSNGNGSASKLPADKKSRVTQKVTKLMEAMIARGMDPEDMLDEAIESYAKAPPPDAADEVDDDEPEDDTPEDDERGEPTGRRAAPVERRNGHKRSPANGNVVVKGSRSNGRPKVAQRAERSRTRVVDRAAGSK